MYHYYLGNIVLESEQRRNIEKDKSTRLLEIIANILTVHIRGTSN